MNPAIGIDLGTTNTVVAAVRDGRAVTLKDDKGLSLLPSVVSFHPSNPTQAPTSSFALLDCATY